MPIVVFLSTVSDEFRAYRDQLSGDLTRHNVAVKVQEHFKDLGGDTLDKLDVYIAHCDAVVHLVGDMCGATPDETQQQALLAKHSDLSQKLPPLGEALKNGFCLPYTQWEAWLALLHGKPLMIAKANAAAPRGPKYAPSDDTRATQAAHLERLKDYHRYSCVFANPDDLAKHIAYSAILDLLVGDYAEKYVRERDVAEGFIREMAKRVAGDAALDLDGMKQEVRNAIEVYERQIAGGQTQTNIDSIVDMALASAKAQIDKGQSSLARATLRRAAEEMRRDEDERRERYVVGVTTLSHRERDIALAAYDGDGAARAIVELAHSIHGANGAKIGEFLSSDAQSLYEYGRDRGSNVHLRAAIALRREQLELAVSADERGAAQNNLGLALSTLGERENGTARLEEAVAAFREALEEYTRDRVPLSWAATQVNLGGALFGLGERQNRTARLEEAVAAYRAALEEYTRDRVPLFWAAAQVGLGRALVRLGERESGRARLMEAVAAYRSALEERARERVPLDWAATQLGLGSALLSLAERESGTARLEEAVAAYHAALEEYTRERVPLQWAVTQNNLGNALRRLAERESGMSRLEEAVATFRAALEESKRERVPLDWATAQNNLGNALVTLGERESGTARLEEAVVAFRAALEEQTREQVPLRWAMTQSNLGFALMRLGQRESGTAQLEQAIAAYHAALEERLRERVPLDWAMTQHNLGNALRALGERESGTARLEEAIAAYGAALEELTRERGPLRWAASFGNQGVAMMLIADRTNGGALAETAVKQIEAAYETLREGGQQQWAAFYERQLPKAQAIRDRLKDK